MAPLLTGAAADRARAVVADIAATLRDPSVHDADPGFRGMEVARGTAGAAVLYAELFAEYGDQADADTALAMVDSAMELAAEERPTALLYPGTAGVGWALAYLEGRLVEPDPDENDVDLLVAQALTSTSWPSADLIRGVTGAGLYLLERGRPSEAVVTRLAEMSTSTPQGTTWWVDPATCLPERAASYPKGYYDVGLAHGQAGTVVLLAHYVAAGVESARPLLESATQWLLAQRLSGDGAGPGRYPAMVAVDEEHPPGTRVAWCYGDPGVAVALLAAGRALGDDTVAKEGLETAVEAAGRTGEGSGVVDAPLCHGSAGNLHLFDRLWRQTGDERLADAARHWFGVTLSLRREGEPVAGYGAWRYEPRPGYEPLAGFLEGATGVALALLAATSDRPADWDSLLLVKPVS